MPTILKPLYEILTGNVAICNHWLYNYLFLAAVGGLAYQLTYKAVGDFYASCIIRERVAGSVVHWVIRLFIYVGTAYLLRALICTYNFVILVPLQVWLALFGLLITGLVIYIAYRIVHRGAV